MRAASRHDMFGKMCVGKGIGRAIASSRTGGIVRPVADE